MRLPVPVIIGVLFFAAVASGQQEEGQKIMRYFQSKHQISLQESRTIRHLEAKGTWLGNSGKMNVEVERRGDTLKYKVLEEEGSAYIRSKVLKKVLDGEREMLEKGDSDKIAFSSQNYVFISTGETEGGLWKLLATPLRQGDFLTENVLLVDSSGTLIRSMGKLRKNPSFLVHDVNVEVIYGLVYGVRVPIHLKSTAKIRFFGSSTFEMWYRYLSVNGREVK